MPGTPKLLRRGGRRGFRRLVYLCASILMLLLAPSAGASPPEISVTIAGTLGANGWYRSNVTINWTVVGAEYSEGCNAVTLSVDTLGQKITCRATNGGDETSKSVTIKLDKTAPTASAVPSRAPDANGWYNQPLTVGYTGTDATSGIASCSSSSYGGPDNATAAVAGSCADTAGNAASATFSFKYDATAPSLFAVAAKLGNRSAEVAWRKSADTHVVEVLRAPGRNGQGESVIYTGSETGFRDTGLVVGKKYEYRVAGIDEAANRAEHKLDLVARGALLSPAPGEQVKVTAPPRLVWTPVKGATHYNVQVIIRGRKVLSAWPAQPGFRLRRTWIYNGRRYRLRPGLYRWYVWPGFRGRKDPYGRLLGSSTFVVTS
jgi:hypothetical protein